MGSRSAARPSPNSAFEASTLGHSAAGSPLGTRLAAQPFRLFNLEREVTMKWVTRERPIIDRIACPWLIARFIDKDPEFLFVPPSEVTRTAAETGAIPYDVPGVELTHVGEGCSFDTFVQKYGLDEEPAILTIAAIVRGADTDRHDLTPQSSGLLAISMGLRDLSPDDHEVLRHGF